MTGSDKPDGKRIAPLAANKKALLEKLKAQRAGKQSAKESTPQATGAGGAAPERIERVPRSESMQLSSAQERMWFLWAQEPDSSAYNVPFAARLRGKLDHAMFRRALESLDQRHTILRTRYALERGVPVAVVDPEAAIEVEVDDLRDLPQADREGHCAARMTEAAHRPFDLSTGPVGRAHLFLMEGDASDSITRHVVLLFVVHHIAADQWSFGVLERELLANYIALVGGLDVTTRPPALEYCDYAAWQRGDSGSRLADTQLAYWSRVLLPPPERLELPRRGAASEPATGRIPITLDARLSGSVLSLGRRHEATSYMVTLAALTAVLSRVTGQTDIAVATAVAGRSRDELSDMVGFFANTLVIRVDADGDPTFAELLKRTRHQCLDAFANQDVPFERVVQAVNPARREGDNPLFQVLFAYANASAARGRFGEFEIEPIEVDYGRARVDLALVLEPGGPDDAVSGHLEFDARKVSEAAARTIARQLVEGLEAAVEKPTVRLSQLVTGDEAVTLPWNRLAAPTHTVIDAFVEMAAAHPDVAALAMGARVLSYAEVERRSRSLAGVLVDRGIRRGDRVAVFMDRSPEAIIAVLAIMRAGAGYLPFETRSPRDRVEYMVGDANPKLMLTDRRHAKRIPMTDYDGPVVPFVVVAEDDTHESEATLPALSLNDLAYAIYTSGSTGAPKAALLHHRGLANVVRGLVATLDVGVGDRIMQYVSLGFDVAASEIFKALTSGATLVMAAQHQLLPGQELVDLWRALDISIVSLPASLLNGLSPGSLPRLRALIVGGETCPPETIASWHPGRRMLNCYGPTEASICATYSDVVDGGFQGIGRPLPNVRAYVVDEQLAPVGRGVAGQLAIGGLGVGRGYASRPRLTATAFVPDPYGEVPGSRMYLTGDLARMTDDGCIDFLGRVDQQLKIRGHRVEPGECEAALVRHPVIEEAAVVARGRGDATALVAYLVCSGPAPSTRDVRDFLAATVPDYMLPSSCVVLASLPRTASGKLDRKALPAPDETEDQPTSAPPRDALEKQLVEIWAAVLDVPSLGITDDFFDIGGNSFVILKLLSAIEVELGHRLPMNTVFEQGNVAAMADLIRTRDAERQAHPSLVRMRSKATTDRAAVLCVHPVGGNVLCYGRLSRLVEKGFPVFGLVARGAEPGAEARDNLDDMATAYTEDVLERFNQEESFVILGWSFGGGVAFEMARRLHKRGRHVAMLGLLDATAPMARDIDIETADLMAQLLSDLGGMFGVASPSREVMRSTDDEGLMTLAVEHVARIGLFKPGTERVEITRHVSMYRAHMNASLRHHPTPFDGSATYFTAEHSARREEILARWRALVTGGLDVVSVREARHSNLLMQPHVATIADVVNQSLRALQP